MLVEYAKRLPKESVPQFIDMRHRLREMGLSTGGLLSVEEQQDLHFRLNEINPMLCLINPNGDIGARLVSHKTFDDIHGGGQHFYLLALVNIDAQLPHHCLIRPELLGWKYLDKNKLEKKDD